MHAGKEAGIAKVLIAGGPVRREGKTVSHAGMGIVVDARHVLTCAHVVNVALGLKEDATPQPDGQIPVVFPFKKTERPVSGRVVAWHPMGADFAEDIAVVELEADAPADVGVAQLAGAPPRDNDALMVYGCKAGSESGGWIDAKFSGTVRPGRVQIDGTSVVAFFIEGGYSGAAVWDLARNRVVGMVSDRTPNRADRVAYMIPVAALEQALSSITDRPPSRSPASFDPRPEDVRRAIRTRLDKIKDCKLLDENEKPVGVLTLVWDELGCGDLAPGEDMMERIAGFLTGRCADADLTGLVRVFRVARQQGKQEAAQRIGEIVDLMLPLCLPAHVLQEAWQQLHDRGAVMIRTSVTRKTGAEILMAGLHHKPARLRKGSSEPIGELLVPYEGEPIGDPRWNVEAALRDLFVASFPAEVKEGDRAMTIALSPEQMKQRLIGLYRYRKDWEKRPCYCVVKLAAHEVDRQNQARLLAGLGIPHLLFVGLSVASDTAEFETYIIGCLNTRFDAEAEGPSA